MPSADDAPRYVYTPGALYRKWFKNWLNRRLPPRRSISLTRTNVFIFPARAGFAFLAAVSILWLIATNYENNLVFILCFLLVSLFVVSILHTYSNLAGIQITAIRSKAAFVGEDAEFELQVQRNNKRHYENLLLSWKGMPPQIINLTDQGQQRIKLYLTATQRGWLKPGRLLVQTYYPVGLLRAWTWLDLDIDTLVYPKPVSAGPVPLSEGTQGQGDLSRGLGSEDFFGLKKYRAGESLRHVAWKQYARGQGLYTKEYAASVDRRLWLDWDYLAGMDRESRLSRLCYWVLESAKTTDEYGLRLPNIEIAPGKGIDHMERLLRTLALFELEPGS